MQATQQQLAEDEESYYEEVEVSGSYTEEEYEEEVVSPIPPARPPHPLFGGGGNAALLNQIKARGATPAASQGVSRSDPVLRKPAPAPQSPPKASSPTRPPTAPGQLSMAEQVAMMAAKRQRRLEGGGSLRETPVSPVAPTPPLKAMVVPPPVKAAAAEPPKKKGLFGGGAAASAANKDGKLPATKVTSTPKPGPQTTAPMPAAEPYTIKSYKPEPITSPASAAAIPAVSALTQDRLKATGRREDRPVATTVESSAKVEQSAADAAATTAPITTTTRTTTITKTKRVTKSDPQYDMVEYKVGCFCAIM